MKVTSNPKAVLSTNALKGLPGLGRHNLQVKRNENSRVKQAAENSHAKDCFHQCRPCGALHAA